MALPTDTRWPRLARHAAHGLRHAVRLLRQHAGHPQLGEAAVARACRLVLPLLATRPLQLQLHADAVSVAGARVQRHEPGEVPFGALHAAGIGELTLQRDLSAADLRTLLQLLAAAASDDRGGGALVRALRHADLPGVQLHAATVHEPLPRDDDGPGWLGLAGADPRFAPLQARIERDRDANLATLAARRLLHLLEVDSQATTGAAHLPALLDVMLQRGNAGAIAWLLDAAQLHPAVPADVDLALRQRVQTAWSGPWLDEHLGNASPAELQALTALGIQLGGEALQVLFARAADLSIDLPPGLADLPTG